MEEPGHPTNWQSLGSTLNHELHYVTHLDPHEHAPSNGGVHKQRVARSQSTRAARSKEPPRLHRNPSMRFTSRLKRFLHRLTWHERTKTYLFGKQYLQRQPSFVMTPDRSSYTYHFRSRDLVKSKPHPRYERSSQPIAAWKHANPMTVLLNKGQVSGPQLESDAAKLERGADMNNEAENAARSDHFRENDETHSLSALDRASHTTPQTWQKVSLPVKQDRTSASSHEKSDPQASEESTPRHRTNASGAGTGSGSGSKNGSQPRSKTNISFGSIDIPPTPLETRKPPPKSADLPSRNIFFVADGERAVPTSPTSARSMYRPESWRRSAIVSRNAHIPDSDPSDLDVAIEFVGAWGTYLKRAIAVRAVAERKRKSWELLTERRWSCNLPYDTDTASSFGSSSASSQTRSGDFDMRPDVSSDDSSDHFSDDHNSSGPSNDERSPAFDETASLQSPDRSTNRTDSLHSSSQRSVVSPERDDSHRAPSSPNLVGSDAMVSSSSIQYTPEAISIPSSTRTQTSIQQRSPTKSTSSLAPPNSPRALAAMARTSAERKRFSDSVDEAQKRYSMLFYKDTEDNSLHSPAKTVVQGGSELGDLQDLSQWPAEDSDKDLAPLKPSDSSKDPSISALRVNKTHESPRMYNTSEAQNEDFDFTDLTIPRKRPLPESPVSTPVGSSVNLSLNTGEADLYDRRLSSGSMNSAIEDAPSLLKSQSMRKHFIDSSHKRVKSSVSRENILLMRQNTLRSQWAEEESDTDASEHLGSAI